MVIIHLDVDQIVRLDLIAIPEPHLPLHNFDVEKTSH